MHESASGGATPPGKLDTTSRHATLPRPAWLQNQESPFRKIPARRRGGVDVYYIARSMYGFEQKERSRGQRWTHIPTRANYIKVYASLKCCHCLCGLLARTERDHKPSTKKFQIKITNVICCTPIEDTGTAFRVVRRVISHSRLKTKTHEAATAVLKGVRNVVLYTSMALWLARN